MIAVLGLILGIVLGLVLQPAVPLWLQPYLPIAVVAALDAVFGAVRAALEGVFDDRVFVISFLANVLGRGPDRLPRRPARRGRAAVHRRRRGAGDADLLQRGGDPPAPVRRLSVSATPTDDPAASRARLRAALQTPGHAAARSSIGLLFALLGFGLALQVRSHRAVRRV